MFFQLDKRDDVYTGKGTALANLVLEAARDEESGSHDPCGWPGPDSSGCTMAARGTGGSLLAALALAVVMLVGRRLTR